MQTDGQSAHRYRPIADYALIGNTFTAALVAPDGAIDWCCLPHFDSGAVFCRLLDARAGGCFRVGPARPASVSRRYLDGSAVLLTEFRNEQGLLRLVDCMPAPPLVDAQPPPFESTYGTLLRRLECAAGTVDVEVLFRPTVDFGRQPTRWAPAADGCRVVAAEQSLRLVLPPAASLRVAQGEARASLRLQEGEVAWVTLLHDGEAVRCDDWALPPENPAQLLQQTLQRWREWAAVCDYDGPYRDAVHLSARVLKLLTFTPSGGIVAAPTTSLPELIGGQRNWDYRFCWLRDSALVLHALLSLGYANAADRFFSWLTQQWQSERRLQIMYRLDGGEHLPEVTLPHLEGYCGSQPVRVGNAAAQQVQLDVYGHLLDAACVYLQRRGATVSEKLAAVLSWLTDETARRWREPDQGLWEMRRPPAHHVSSKLLCWVALDRALQLAQAGHIRGDIASWQREREAVRRALQEHGYNARLGAFTQLMDGKGALDASVLLMPIVGFLPAGDERMRSTVERIREQLTRRGLVYRYNEPDGMGGSEGAFAICSFWMVDNLALQGRVTQARALFEHLLSFASDLGLLAEEIEPADGRLLGNYPQGYTHLALIRSALTIANAERSRDSLLPAVRT